MRSCASHSPYEPIIGPLPSAASLAERPPPSVASHVCACWRVSLYGIPNAAGRTLPMSNQVAQLSHRADSAPRVPKSVHVFNPILKRLLAAGVPLGVNGLVTIRGRKSGLPRTTPLAI